MRKDNKVFTTLHATWWMSLVAALASYLLLKYLVPQLNINHPDLRNICEAGPTFAPIVAIPFLLLAAKQLYDGDRENEESSDTTEKLSGNGE